MIEFANSLRVESLSHSYSGIQVFRDISFELHSGDALVILGPNGTGKSTLLKCLCNILEPEEGRVSFNDEDNNTLRRKRRLTRTYGYLSQSQSSVPDIPAFEYTVTGRAPYVNTWGMPKKKDYEFVMSCFKSLEIEHLYYRSYADISGGEQQQIQIARILCQEPRVILFDEPCSQLDLKNQQKILGTIKMLQSRGYIVIFSTHNPAHALFSESCQVGAFFQNDPMKFRIFQRDMLKIECIASIYGLEYHPGITHFSPKLPR